MNFVKLLILLIVAFIAFKAYRAIKLRAQQRKQRQDQQKSQGKMVPCAYCKTRLPESEAYSDSKHYFCDRDHYQAYIENKKP